MVRNMEVRLIQLLDDTLSLKDLKECLDKELLRDGAYLQIKNSFSDLTKRKYFPLIANKLFLFVIDYPGYFNDEILYLLNYDKRFLNILSVKQLKDLIYYVPNAPDYIIERINDLDPNKQEIITDLTCISLNNKDSFMRLLEQVFASNSLILFTYFIMTLAKNNFNDYNEFISFLGKTEMPSLPTIMADYSYLSNNLIEFLVSNFDYLLSIEQKRKMELIYTLDGNLPRKVSKNYKGFIKLIDKSETPMFTTECLNIVFKNNLEKQIRDYIDKKTIRYLKMGSTTQAFRIGMRKVLKYSRSKNNPNTLYKHFLLAPTERTIIFDEYNHPDLYIEKQDYLSKYHNGKRICDEDFDNYFEEARKQKILLQDPHCVRRMDDNFGFLRDYHDATLVGVNSHEELPDWFKRRPLVMYDIDMVTDIGETPKKKTYTKREK